MMQSSFQEMLSAALRAKGVVTEQQVRDFSKELGFSPGYLGELTLTGGRVVPGDGVIGTLAKYLDFDAPAMMLLVRIRLGQDAQALLHQHLNGGPKLTAAQVKELLPR